jgi:hypothetical protein
LKSSILTVISLVFFVLIIPNYSFAQEQEISSLENKMFVNPVNPSYNNHLYGFSIDAPKTWLVEEHGESIGGENSIIVSFNTFQTNPNYVANFFIIYDNVTPEYVDSLNQYTEEEIIDQYISDLFTSNTKIFNKDIKVYSDGYKITLEFGSMVKLPDNNFVPVHQEAVYFILQNGDRYLLKFTSTPEEFDESVKKFRDSVNTFYVGDLQIAKGFSGKYIDDALGFEFLIPSGWYAVQGIVSDAVLFLPTTNVNMTMPDFSIVMSTRDESKISIPSESSDDKNNDCIDDISYKILNTIPIRERSSLCNDNNFKGYSFVKNGKIVSIGYQSNQLGDEFRVKDFEKLVSTLKVDNPSPIKDAWRQANDFQIYHKKISNTDSELEIKYYSTSQVDKFTVDLKNKQIMLTVNESENVGSTIIPISKFFVKPYSIIVDGKKNELDLTEDEIEGITEISVNYEKGTHTIKISGNDLVSDLVLKSSDISEPAKSDSDTSICGTGTIEKEGKCVPAKQEKTSKSSGGCLIATATYGSELAPHVQQLRELRDNSLLQTSSGTSFMAGFNQFYYSFSPTIADWERENPIFKELVKITLTPMISSLSILNYVNMDSEASVLVYGISLIMLNVGMYFVTPAIMVFGIRKYRK